MATLRTISGFSLSSRSRLSLLLKISRLNIDPTSFYFTLNKCSSKAFIYLTFIIYYISQKRSRDLTLIDQYFFILFENRFKPLQFPLAVGITGICN